MDEQRESAREPKVRPVSKLSTFCSTLLVKEDLYFRCSRILRMRDMMQTGAFSEEKATEEEPEHPSLPRELDWTGLDHPKDSALEKPLL